MEEQKNGAEIAEEQTKRTRTVKKLPNIRVTLKLPKGKRYNAEQIKNLIDARIEREKENIKGYRTKRDNIVKKTRKTWNERIDKSQDTIDDLNRYYRWLQESPNGVMV